MKVRLLLRAGIADADGRCIAYDYLTTIVDVTIEGKSPEFKPEIIGGKYLPGQIKEGSKNDR